MILNLGPSEQEGSSNHSAIRALPSFFLDDTSMSDMMRNFPNALVKFELYSHSEEMRYRDKRLNRIKTKNTIPLGPWAKQVVEGILFSKTIF